MKKTVLFIAGVMFFASALTPVWATTSYPKVVVSEKTETATSGSEAVIPTPTPEIEYTLPYPGVLPDNPLYFLKTVRDRIMEWLIADPMRKIDFYILQSDKNLNAGIMLNLANKKTLVSGVLTQSVTDMEKAAETAASVKNTGREIPSGVIDHMTQSLKKHEEVFASLANVTLVTKAKSLEEVVSKLK